MNLKTIKSYKQIGEGTTRLAYLSPKGTVFKILKYDKDHSIYVNRPENRQEVLLWLFVQGTALEHLFLPILDHCPKFTWIEMPFCKDVDYTTVKDSNPLVPSAWKDQCYFNFGLYQDRIVIRDYGGIRSIEEFCNCHLKKWQEGN